MTTLPPAQKLLFHRSLGRTQPFADLYRFGGAGPGAPLVVYVGEAPSIFTVWHWWRAG